MKLILQSTILLFKICILIATVEYLIRTEWGLSFLFPKPLILHSILQTLAVVGWNNCFVANFHNLYDWWVICSVGKYFFKGEDVLSEVTEQVCLSSNACFVFGRCRFKTAKICTVLSSNACFVFGRSLVQNCQDTHCFDWILYCFPESL
jgi:hypothetical protein